MRTLFLLQLVVPLALLAWMGLMPPSAWLAFWLQAVATATALWTMALLGIWLVPPWWTPLAFGVALAVVVAIGLRRRRPFASALPVAWGARLTAGFFLVLGMASAYGLASAWRSRVALPLPALNLSFPLEPGSYLVVNGGGSIHTNAHLMSLDAGVLRFREWRGQSHGVDIVKLDAFGLRARGLLPADPKAYAIYGARVLAPCAGRGLARGGWSARQAGSAGGPRAHEPHLHVHAQRPGPVAAPVGGDPLPITFNGRFPVRGDRIGSP